MLILVPAWGRDAISGKGANLEKAGLFFLVFFFSLLHPRCPPCVCEPEDGNDGQVGHAKEGREAATSPWCRMGPCWPGCGDCQDSPVVCAGRELPGAFTIVSPPNKVALV